MTTAAVAVAAQEAEFVERVNDLASETGSADELIALLNEDGEWYAGRSAAAVSRMRGWVLRKLAEHLLPEEALPFVLEELDTGTDPYLIAVAARALRSASRADACFVRHVADALRRVRYRDEPIAFGPYGTYALTTAETTPVQELIATLEWLGDRLDKVDDVLDALNDVPKKYREAATKAARTIALERTSKRAGSGNDESCCSLPGFGVLGFARDERNDSRRLEDVLFEDQDGGSISFKDFFTGRPAVVVFFYTRCDNPLKCSLTISSAGAVQRLLEERGLAGKVRTAAITYDPAFDLAPRLRRYGEERGYRFDDSNRFLRTSTDSATIRRHFGLAVNFVGSIVNRHRVELFVLDAEGRIAGVFERLRFDPKAVVDRAEEVLREPTGPSEVQPIRAGALASLPAVVLALLPKCPACWAAYLAAAGIAGAQVPDLTPLQPLLFGFVLLNVMAVSLRARLTRHWAAPALVVVGAVVLAMARVAPPGSIEAGWFSWLGMIGAALTAIGSVWSVLPSRRRSARLRFGCG